MFNFITQILDSAPEIWTNATQTAAAEFKARLATETVIRIYVDNTINFFVLRFWENTGLWLNFSSLN